MAAPAPSRRAKRRQLRLATKRRVRGGVNRAPVPVQRLARGVDDAAYRTRRRLRRVLAGDRGFLVGFVVLLAVGIMVISGPLRAYLDQRDRVDLLERQLTVLDDANAGLEQRAADLRDPEQLRAEARERLGYVEPGEVPYVVVPPQQDPSTVVEPLEVPEAAADRPWYRSVWDALTGWFG